MSLEFFLPWALLLLPLGPLAIEDFFHKEVHVFLIALFWLSALALILSANVITIINAGVFVVFAFPLLAIFKSEIADYIIVILALLVAGPFTFLAYVLSLVLMVMYDFTSNKKKHKGIFPFLTVFFFANLILLGIFVVLL